MDYRSEKPPKINRTIKKDITHQDRVITACNIWLDQNVSTDVMVTKTIPTVDPNNPNRLLKQKVICPFCETVISLSVSNFRYAVTSNFKRHILKVHVSTPRPMKEKLVPNNKSVSGSGPKR